MGTWCMLIIRFNVNISEEKDYLIKVFLLVFDPIAI